nr:MAG TPA: hypothetical protein [Caudoviricetes sp.]DAQ99406.1 MAG TPA: hypothetical protein [Caudoviricetes sp.]
MSSYCFLFSSSESSTINIPAGSNKRKRKRIAPSLFSTQRDGLSCAS